MELFDLAGKVAVITGSSRGIGKAMAQRMAEHGAKVVISSRKAGPCEAVAAEINAKHPGAAIAIPANISSKEDLKRLIDETRAAFGRIDILVCNAASNPYYGPMSGIGDDAFRKILDNNIISNHWLIQMVAPEMIERRDAMPPSTVTMVPLVYPERSEARNRKRSVISATCAGRPSGYVAASSR